MKLGLLLMLYGLGGVFLVLVLFYLSIKILSALFPEKENK
ncbi:MAG: hypothetical protein GX196_06320 [Clostridiaceae bacterium]|nr:hypothetical protein [Clostridiaceae bacterium]